MPNWCYNTVYITNANRMRLKEIREAAKNSNFFEYVCPINNNTPYEIDENQIEAWGTKWDIPKEEYYNVKLRQKTLQLSFHSAWSPPIAVYQKLFEQGFSVRAFFFEPGINFAGIWKDGNERTTENAIEDARKGIMDPNLYHEMGLEAYVQNNEIYDDYKG